MIKMRQNNENYYLYNYLEQEKLKCIKFEYKTRAKKKRRKKVKFDVRKRDVFKEYIFFK